VRAAEDAPETGHRQHPRDITARKQSEEALKAAQQQLVDAIESISEGFVIFERGPPCPDQEVSRPLPASRRAFAPGRLTRRCCRVASGIHDVGDDPEGWIRRNMEWHRACDSDGTAVATMAPGVWIEHAPATAVGPHRHHRDWSPRGATRKVHI
jgi:hypothetical protein